MKNHPKTRQGKRLFYLAPIFTVCPQFMALPMDKKRVKKYKRKALFYWRILRHEIASNH